MKEMYPSGRPLAGLQTANGERFVLKQIYLEVARACKIIGAWHDQQRGQA